MARVEVTRSGGLAGIALRTELDTSELPADEASALERLLADVDLSAAPGRPAAMGPDRFQYDLSVTRGQDRLSVSLGEGEVPVELRRLLDQLLLRDLRQRRGRAQG